MEEFLRPFKDEWNTADPVFTNIIILITCILSSITFSLGILFLLTFNILKLLTKTSSDEESSK